MAIISQNKFHSFPSIENPREKIVQSFLTLDPHAQWVALEKIHGANFSLLYNGAEICACKRSGPIAPDENFYNWGAIVERYTASVKTIFDTLRAADQTVHTIQVFGELFGGNYPGIKEKGTKQVQAEIYYTAANEFLAFDILVNEDYFLSQSELNSLFTSIVIPLRLVPVLHRGTFEELYKLHDSEQLAKLESKIYSMFGLPRVENNIAEGYILKQDSRHSGVCARPILKLKGPAFCEKRHSKQARIVDTNNADDLFIESIKDYMTENRLAAVASKEGPDCHPQKLLNLFINDAVADFCKDTCADYEKIRQLVGKKLHAYAAGVGQN